MLNCTLHQNVWLWMNLLYSNTILRNMKTLWHENLQSRYKWKRTGKMQRMMTTFKKEDKVFQTPCRKFKFGEKGHSSAHSYLWHFMAFVVNSCPECLPSEKDTLPIELGAG